jgi:predicted lipoprotein with Yx(FWY)xxD motif
MRNKILFSALLGLALLISACGAATPAPTAAPVATATTAPAATATAMPVATASAMPVATASAAATVMVSQNATLGSFLVDSKGMTLYLYTNDTPGTSTCSGGCATNWPPLLTNGAPIAGQGVNAAMLGITTRADGTTQVTYNSWPLYYFAGDSAAGDTNGEGKGSVWYVMTPAGTKQ